MWEIHIKDQLLNSVYSLALGGLVCFYYDLLYIVRVFFKFGKILTFLTDILFWCSLAVVTFTFLLAVSNGEIRLYILFFMLVGFFAVRRLFSRFLRKGTKRILNSFTKIYRGVSGKFYKIFGLCERATVNILRKSIKNTEKWRKSLKKLLKKHRKM